MKLSEAIEQIEATLPKPDRNFYTNVKNAAAKRK